MGDGGFKPDNKLVSHPFWIIAYASLVLLTFTFKTPNI
jgi:hypothetical protein